MGKLMIEIVVGTFGKKKKGYSPIDESHPKDTNTIVKGQTILKHLKEEFRIRKKKPLSKIYFCKVRGGF